MKTGMRKKKKTVIAPINHNAEKFPPFMNVK